MRKPRYTVFDTGMRKYLKQVTRPVDGADIIHTEWTRHAEQAMRFQGVKSAQRVIGLLGNFSEYVIRNSRGEII